MAKKPDKRANFEADDAGGALGGLLAEEREFDGRMMWRIASWGVGATAAVVLAIMANQSSPGMRREQVAAVDLSRQAHQIQTLTRESQVEARRLSAAVETLTRDRDRLISRVATLEQGLDSVTGTITRQGHAAPPAATAEPKPAQNPQPAPSPAPVAAAPAAAPVAEKLVPAESNLPPVPTATKEQTKSEIAKPENNKPLEPARKEASKPEPTKVSPATPLMPTRSIMAPPDAAAGSLLEPAKDQIVTGPLPDVIASHEADADDTDAPKASLQRTEFGVDVGTANSMNGLRALWRGLLKSRSNAPLAALRPIVVIKEASNGLGMQLRLVAGPLNDAGAAAKICAAMTENNRPCETTVFEGQRLSLKVDDAPAAPAKPAARRHGSAKRAPIVEEEPKKPEAAPPPPAPTGISAIFSRTSSQ